MVNQQELNHNRSSPKPALFWLWFAPYNCLSNTTAICVTLHRRSDWNLIHMTEYPLAPSKMTLHADWDVLSTIHNHLKWFLTQPILHHIRSHQVNDPTRTVPTLKEQLNVYANSLATTTLHLLGPKPHVCFDPTLKSKLTFKDAQLHTTSNILCVKSYNYQHSSDTARDGWDGALQPLTSLIGIYSAQFTANRQRIICNGSTSSA